MAEILLATLSVIIFLAMILSVFLWGAFVIRLAQGHSPLQTVARSRAPWDHVEVLLTIGMLMMGSTLATRALQFFGFVPMNVEKLSDLETSQQAMVMLSNSLIQLLIAVGLLVWIAGRSNSVRSDLGLTQPFHKLVAIGVISAIMIIPPVTVIQAIVSRLIEYKHDLLEMINNQPSFAFYAVAGITGVLVAPFAEEVFFRMLFQGWLESQFGKRTKRQEYQSFTEDRDAIVPAKLIATEDGDENPYQPSHYEALSPSDDTRAIDAVNGHSSCTEPEIVQVTPPWWPIFVSAFLFGIAHLGQGPAPFSLFFFSLGLGFLYRQTHSIVPCITVHFILNAMTLSIVMLSGSV